MNKYTMNWSAIPYHYEYKQNVPLMTNDPQSLFTGNDVIPHCFFRIGRNLLKTSRSFIDFYERNNTLEALILEQINRTLSCDENEFKYDPIGYQCFAFSYKGFHLIAIVTDDFCLNLIYNENHFYYIMGQSDGYSLDVQTNDFRYLYNSEFSDDTSKDEQEKTPQVIYDQLDQCYSQLTCGPEEPWTVYAARLDQ